MPTYPKKGDPIRALVNSPDVLTEPNENAPKTQHNVSPEAILGLRDFLAGEIIGLATGVTKTRSGRIYIEATTTFYVRGGWPFYNSNEQTALCYVFADDETVSWENTNSPNTQEAVASLEDIQKELATKYYPKWGNTIPHVDSVVKKTKDGSEQWFIKFPNGYGNFLSVFDELSLATKEQLTGVADSTTDPTKTTVPTKVAADTKAATGTTSTLLTPTNIILAIAVIGLFGLIITLLRKKPAKP